MSEKNKSTEECVCRLIDPAVWDNKELIWQDKLFVQDRIISFLHMPLNFGSVMNRNMSKIEAANALSADALWLTEEKSLWGADLFIAVDKEVSGVKMDRLSGTFMTKVFEGPYKNMMSWINQMQETVKSRGKELKKMYFFYTTCPKCAKKFGKNYVVILAQV